VESHDARVSLQAVDGAPDLSRRPSAVEFLAGALSVLVVLFGCASLIISEPPRLGGILAAGVVLVLVLTWITRRSPGRPVWRPIDHVARWVALIAALLPMQQLIWPAEDSSVVGAWIASSIAALALGGFLALRWRR
jgi:hypothetical protein